MIQLLEHRAISPLAGWLALILVTGGCEHTRALRKLHDKYSFAGKAQLQLLKAAFAAISKQLAPD